MTRTPSIRKTLATLALGTALALPGLQIAHAAPTHQSGPVLAGDWVDFAKGAPVSSLQITAVTNGGVDGGLPTSITYGVNDFSVPANRFVAFGVSAPVPFSAADRAVVPLTPLTPQLSVLRLRTTTTTLTLSLIDNGATAQPGLRVAIHTFSLLRGNQFSVEIMQRP